MFCSDEDVTAVSEAEVLRSKAYMLCVPLKGFAFLEGVSLELTLAFHGTRPYSFYERVDAKTGQVPSSAIPANTADVDVLPIRSGSSNSGGGEAASSLSAAAALAPSASTTPASTTMPSVLGGEVQPVAEPLSVEDRVPATVPE